MNSLLHTIEPHQPVARETGLAARSGRFRGNLLFVSGTSYPRRGMLYSLLLHAAAMFVLLSVPIPVQQATDLLEAEPLAFDALPSSNSGSNISSASVAQEAEAALKDDTRQASAGATKRTAVARCCSPRTIVSNPPQATNRAQTILQPDFADRPPLDKFVPLPNMLKLAPTPSNSTKHAPASGASPKSVESDLQAMQPAPVLATPFVPILPAPLPPPSPTSAAASESKDSQTSQERVREGSGGNDSRDILALSVVPAPPSDVLPVPMGESRGQFVILASPTPTATDGGSHGAAALKRPANDEKAAVSAARPVRWPNAFAGITIQGGEWNRDSLATQPGDPDARATRPEIASYPLTIASAGNSGGGLRDFGAFANEMVYTNYFTLERVTGYVAPCVLQFALAEPLGGAEDSVTPPRPVTEVLPSWPEDTAAPYTGEMIVVYAEIAPDGKIQEIRVLESPSADLNRALLDALAQWTFRPAAVNGRPAAVKVLLGFPVAPYE